MQLVTDPYDKHSPYVACDMHIEDLKRIDFHPGLKIAPASNGACVMCVSSHALCNERGWV